MTSKEVVVYTAGTFDLFHVGHLNLLKAAKGLGDRLIVAVSSDELVEDYKRSRPIMSYEERYRIVSELRCVDVCIPQYSRDKYEAWKRIGFDIWVVGDDWYDDEQYREWEKRLRDEGVRVVFLPYTRTISTTKIKRLLKERKQEVPMVY